MAYRCLVEFGITPDKVVDFDEQTKAFIIASLMVKDKDQEEAIKKAESEVS